MAATTIVEHAENGTISNIVDIGLKSICAKFHASIPKGTILTHIYCTIEANQMNLTLTGVILGQPSALHPEQNTPPPLMVISYLYILCTEEAF